MRQENLATQRSTRQDSTLCRLGVALVAVLMLCSVGTMAQQPGAPPLIEGAFGSQTNPAPGPVTKLPATKVTVPGKTMPEMVYGGQNAMSGATEQSGKLGNEGLKIHGHWVIDVQDPDGTPSSHQEFENSVTTGGQALLIGLLAGYVVPADYEIFLQSTSSTSAPCVNPATGYTGCAIVRTLATQPAILTCPNYICNTTLTYAYNNANLTTGSSMVLSGQFTANQNGSINYVSTYAGTCPINPAQSTLATTSPADCLAKSASIGGFSSLTATALTTPTTMTAGQVLIVTVTITFS